MNDFPTLANGAAAPPASDPGDISPPIERATKPRASESPSFAQQRQAQDQAAADKAKPPAATDPEQPAQPGADRVKVGKYETTESELAAMLERQSRDDLRKATIPAAPEAYEAKLPADFKAPGGLEFKLDEAGNKAAFDAARAWAHNKGMTQSDFSEMLGIYASQEAQQHAALAARSAAEVAK